MGIFGAIIKTTIPGAGGNLMFVATLKATQIAKGRAWKESVSPVKCLFQSSCVNSDSAI